MTWKTEPNFENAQDIVRALYSTDTNSVYYITDASHPENEFNEDAGYVLQLWPNRNKSMETVSIIDSFDSLSKAKDALAEKTDESAV